MLQRTLGDSRVNLSEVFNKQTTGAAGAAAVATVNAVADKRHTLHKVIWSYDAPPAAGSTLTITGAATPLTIAVLTAGPGALTPTYVCNVNTNLVATLSAPGGVVIGRVYVEYTTEMD